MVRKFVIYFHFIGWWAISAGLHVDIKSPNLEIHLPFGFLRIGWKFSDSDWAKSHWGVFRYGDILGKSSKPIGFGYNYD